MQVSSSGTSPFGTSSGNYYGDGGDANAALAELDQNLRCGRLGEQAEAIVRFPRLFAKYPFPILINSALLKLADVFRQGSNFIKLCVLCVVRQSERHLDKITNVDEFVKRVLSVLHSNDPVARALTLRTLGAVADIIPERRQAHHNIRHALDSQDVVEVRAAIYAASRFAARSKSFALNMCTKISDLVRGYATPPELKLRLIPMFQHMHHDAHTATMVRNTCVQLLPGYPSQEFVLVTLTTLTRLSGHTLVDVPEQVELLLKHLNSDPRRVVKRQILADLRFLANKDRAHLWSKSNVSSVVAFALDHEEEVLVGALSILCDMVRHTATCKLTLEAGSPVLKLCQSCCYSTTLSVAARATQLATLIASNCVRDMLKVDGVDVTSEAVVAIEALFLLINSQQPTGQSNKALKECLQCVVLLCRVQPEACDQFVDIVGGRLNTSNKETMVLLCETLASLGSMKRGVLKLLLQDICHAIINVVESDTEKKSSEEILALLTTLLFQTLKGHAWPELATTAVKCALQHVDMWCAYRIARTASRYGHHGVASEVFQRVSVGVSSEHLYFWLTGLAQVCQGEYLLNDAGQKDLVDRLAEANVHILEGATSIRASTTPSRNQEFQAEYLRCRSELLQALSQIVYSCHSLRTSPPPAIASSQAKASADDLQRCGRVTPLLRGCVNDLGNVGTALGQLYVTSFDADVDTLAHIHTLQHLCLCLGQWIEMVCLKSSRQGSIFDDQAIEFTPTLVSCENATIEILDVLDTGDKIAKCFRNLVQDPETPPPITDVHTTCLLKVVDILASAQLGLPRLFFQSLQQTSLKLAVTPQPRTASEPIGVSSAQHMAIKVEGVITTSSSVPVPLRKVKSIKLTLNAQLQNATAKAVQNNDAMLSKVPDCNQTLEQVVVPHNDFFSAQFLLPFPVAGTHQVVIETKLIDEEDRTWKTGLKSTMAIKAFEDGQNRPQSSRGVNR